MRLLPALRHLRPHFAAVTMVMLAVTSTIAQDTSADWGKRFKDGLDLFKKELGVKSKGSAEFEKFTKYIEQAKKAYSATESRGNAARFVEICKEYVRTGDGNSAAKHFLKLTGLDHPFTQSVLRHSLDRLHTKNFSDPRKRRKAHALLNGLWRDIKRAGKEPIRTSDSGTSHSEDNMVALTNPGALAAVGSETVSTPDSADLDGLWVDAQMGKGREWYIRIVQAGRRITGTIEDAGSFLKSYGGSAETACQIGRQIFTGEVQGNIVKFKFDYSVQTACLPPETAALFKGLSPYVDFRISEDGNSIFSGNGKSYRRVDTVTN